MKYKIMMIVIFFLFMAAVPLSFVINNTGTSSYQQQTSEKLEEKPDEKEIILRTASLCRDDFSDEAIKAAAIICRTNEVSGKSYGSDDNNNSNLELYKRVEGIYNSNSEILCNNGEPVPVPCSLCSDGSTVKSGDYPYLEAVASPWDAFSELYDSKSECTGVSLNGVSYLCGKGLSAEEALLWYLPKLEIKPV